MSYDLNSYAFNIWSPRNCMKLSMLSEILIAIRFLYFISVIVIIWYGSYNMVYMIRSLWSGPYNRVDMIWLGEIQCKNGISLEKMKKFQNKATDFNFVLFYLKLLIGATDKGGPEKYSTIPFRILGPSKFTESV